MIIPISSKQPTTGRVLATAEPMAPVRVVPCGQITEGEVTIAPGAVTYGHTIIVTPSAYPVELGAGTE
jgi:hypothetical protein